MPIVCSGDAACAHIQSMADDAEVVFEDDGPTVWQVRGGVDEGTDPGEIAGRLVSLLTGETPGHAEDSGG